MSRTKWPLALPFSLWIAACGGDPCAFTSPCPSDAPATQAERTTCRSSLRANETSPCYGEWVGVLLCAQNNFVCGGDGRVDSTLTTTRAQNSCATQVSNLRACCGRSPTASVCQ